MSEVKIDIPKQLIEDTIRAELVRKLSEENKTLLIESIVKYAFDEKPDRYSSQSFFKKVTTEMIQKEVKEIFAEWINENRENIAKALRKYLTENKQKALTAFCEKLSENIASYGVSVNLKLFEKED